MFNVCRLCVPNHMSLGMYMFSDGPNRPDVTTVRQDVIKTDLYLIRQL